MPFLGRFRYVAFDTMGSTGDLREPGAHVLRWSCSENMTMWSTADYHKLMCFHRALHCQSWCMACLSG